MTLQDFYDQLQRHDWFYSFSDDHGVWCAGERDSARLAAIAKESPEHTKLMREFAEHHFSGAAFEKPKAAKPERPKLTIDEQGTF